MRIAITRDVSPAIDRCELSHIERQPIDLAVAREEHRRYEERLAALGCKVISLPAEPDLPDSVFVEDAAFVVDEVAVIARPGAESRRPEVPSIAEVIGRHRRLERIEAPGTLDGGDVLVVGRDVYIGRSARTNEEGARQAAEILEPAGYAVIPVPVIGCLHLKSAVGLVAADTVLINRDWVDAAPFRDVRLLDVDPSEPGAGCALRIDDTVLCSSQFSQTRGRLEAVGLHIETLELSELAKAESGVTCCSIVFEA